MKGLLLLMVLLAAALPADPAASARESLDRWRHSRAPALMDDFAELSRYRQANQQLRPQADRVVFFGDSITDGWKLDRDFPGRPYVNRGIGGQTTAQMLLRFRDDVIALQPRAVVILAGTNDIAGNTGPMSNADIVSNYSSMAELARVHHIRAVFCSVLPVHNYTPESQAYFPLRPAARILALNQWLKDYCQKEGLDYVDYFSAVVDAQGCLRRELADDGLHPNARGYAIMAPLVEAVLNR